MILHETATSRNAAGSDFNPPPNPSLNRLPDAEAHRAATEQMRYQLYLLDRSQRRPSIEEVADALLEAAAQA